MTQPTVAVRGEATILAEPELARISLTVNAEGADHDTTLELLSRRGRSVAELLARLGDGIERSETARVHVYADLKRKKTEKVRRYVGHMSTEIVVGDFSVLSDLVVGAASIDLVTVSGPWWELREDSDVYRRARLAAADDALTRARDYAAAFGAHLVGLVEIADEGMSHERHDPGIATARFAMAAGAAENDGPELDLEPALQHVTGRIEARFLLSQPDLTSERAVDNRG